MLCYDRFAHACHDRLLNPPGVRPVREAMRYVMLPNSPETQQLLDEARQGDRDAVDRLLGQHREPVRRMIDLRLDPAIGKRVDASDVVQEVLLEASKRLSDYLKKPDMPFHLW